MNAGTAVSFDEGIPLIPLIIERIKDTTLATEMVDMVVSAGARVSAVDADGRQPLHLAAMMPDRSRGLALVHKLIAAGT